VITAYRNILTTNEPYYLSVEAALARIQEGKSQELVEQIRYEVDKAKRNEFKKQLPCMLFSGEFSKRNTNGLIRHSGFICLDFDDMDNRDELAVDKYIYACWLSPSGNGVKALVRIPGEDHYGSFLALEKRYPSIDKACKDVSRVCYESYDPDLFVNENAEVFRDVIQVSYEQITVDRPETDKVKIYQLLKKWMEDKGEYFIEGYRHKYLVKLLTACLRFGIPKDTADALIQNDFVIGQEKFEIKEWTDILDWAYTTHASSYGSASFEKGEVIEIETRKEVSAEILDVKLPAKDLIKLDDVYDDMVSDFENGITMGETTYFREIDRHFRWQRGEITAMFGYGNHGKTAMMNQLIHIKCMRENKRFVFFSPEQYPPNDFYHDFVQMHVGQSVMKGPNQMKRVDYDDAMLWVNQHIFYVYPKKENPTPEYILERFTEMIIKHKVDGVVVDPFNQLYHDYSERDDKYLSKILTLFKRFALENKIYFIIIAHPSGGAIEVGADGNYKAPYYTRIAGGIMWGNKMDNILCYNRPYYRTDPKDPRCHFISQKIKKQSRNGIPGLVELNYSRDTYRFTEYTGYDPYSQTVKLLEHDEHWSDWQSV